MPKYEVKVRFVSEVTLNSVYARDEEGAEERAVEIVSDWKNVVEAEATEVNEV